MKIANAHLAYCTNIHPAESWEETLTALKEHTLTVRDKVAPSAPAPGYAIGLRLSARAADELLEGSNLADFKQWLEQENCYVFTINGFPYGSFHGTRVKEQVFLPDWTSDERLDYTIKLFSIIAQLVPEGIDGSVSTLPGSHKQFEADDAPIFKNLEICAEKIEEFSQQYNRDLHLGLEPEPLGHFENTEESLAFFDRFLKVASNPDLIKRRVGINYDTCHFALEFNDCRQSLDALRAAGIRISKVHLSSALEFDPLSQESLESIRSFDEPTYFHQVIVLDSDGHLTRHRDLPDFFASIENTQPTPPDPVAGRIHFHIPLYAEPGAPLRSTQSHAVDALEYFAEHPDFCTHFEIETYTWGVLPGDLQITIEDQIAKEYQWVLERC
ncbi:metabolite traffic protein EboE [Verrucomicrobiaceae bacterium 5K15]|uniref:Metabolite traffic protein EboE n=1 Tax=Oceaniferula flava TaxID=2800421 RepID=A0AAE2SCU0_9BACT|nr:metabolite traffic protein EboE [Oceaniferula flavus]MBK1855830.1 metabolite traffic protein EboE [Oceaniferula flavus]MBM1137137.1 metabolite traffic protein EboE [Oceaniferula flavus]